MKMKVMRRFARCVAAASLMLVYGCSSGGRTPTGETGTTKQADGGGFPAGPAPDGGGRTDDLHAAARRVQHYLANYGSWSSEALALAQKVDLVIAHPGNGNLTRGDVRRLQAGADPSDPSDDVLVLCYVSVGEDLRSHGLSDDQVRADPRFPGNGTGPRIDPRGPDASGTSLAGIDPLGVAS
ncbi:MAG TPA: hypothetical protein VLT58_04660, partial [Polyangia bacterium]|nr:hypothetical protein [Polyangia bacterium]